METVIGTLPDESPLKTELSTQLDSVKEKLKDPRQPGARLDSATAGVKKATARREKAEEALKQAQEALEQARLQETRAIQELEDAKAAAAPPPPPEHFPLFFRFCWALRAGGFFFPSNRGGFPVCHLKTPASQVLGTL